MRDYEFRNFADLSKVSYEYLNEQQKICNERFLLGEHENWFYDQETGLITFSNNKKVCIKFRYESVGSISFISNTWLWSWANDYTLENVATDILKVKEYGEINDIEKLFEEKWGADIYDGWEMTAISAYLMNAIGAYRVPNNDEETIFSFKIFKSIEFIDELELNRLKAHHSSEP